MGSSRKLGSLFGSPKKWHRTLTRRSLNGARISTTFLKSTKIQFTKPERLSAIMELDSTRPSLLWFGGPTWALWECVPQRGTLNKHRDTIELTKKTPRIRCRTGFSKSIVAVVPDGPSFILNPRTGIFLYHSWVTFYILMGT